MGRHDLVDRELLIDAALSAQVALVTSQDKREPRAVEWLGRLRDLLLARVDEQQAVQQARTLVQDRYLDGHGALLSGVASSWDEQVKSTGVIAAMAVRLADLDVPPAASPEPEALSARTAELVADLVEPAKADTLDKLGEGHRAFGIATSWARTKLGSGPASGPETPME